MPVLLQAETLRQPNRQISILNRVANQIPHRHRLFLTIRTLYYQPTSVTWRHRVPPGLV